MMDRLGVNIGDKVNMLDRLFGITEEQKEAKALQQYRKNNPLAKAALSEGEFIKLGGGLADGYDTDDLDRLTTTLNKHGVAEQIESGALKIDGVNTGSLRELEHKGALYNQNQKNQLITESQLYKDKQKALKADLDLKTLGLEGQIESAKADRNLQTTKLQLDTQLANKRIDLENARADRNFRYQKRLDAQNRMDDLFKMIMTGVQAFV